MTNTTILSIISIVLLSFSIHTDFLSEQKKFERVRNAVKNKQATIEKHLKEKSLSLDNLNILLIAYKVDDLLEVYAKSKQESVYTKIYEYRICARSGQLGPKRKQGDGQVPEGFYYIDRFNPTSNYYLSLGLNYPNLSDKKRNSYSDLGGDIFIHGSCVTIGCIPMTDDHIKEIYLLAVYAKNNGQLKIPVYIFPFKMTDKNVELYKSQNKFTNELLLFWDELKIGYDKFNQEHKELKIKISEKGNYQF